MRLAAGESAEVVVCSDNDSDPSMETPSCIWVRRALYSTRLKPPQRCVPWPERSVNRFWFLLFVACNCLRGTCEALGCLSDVVY